MSSKVKVLYLVLTVILPYLKRKLSVVLVRDATGWKSKLLNLLNLTDKILSALSLVNLSVFIYDGKYRNLTQRVLRIPMKFIHGESARILDFTLMNRKIIWHIYELFLKTILPYAHEYICFYSVYSGRRSRTSSTLTRTWMWKAIGRRPACTARRPLRCP